MLNEALFCLLFVPLKCFLLKTLNSQERAVPLWRTHWYSLPDICHEPCQLWSLSDFQQGQGSQKLVLLLLPQPHRMTNSFPRDAWRMQNLGDILGNQLFALWTLLIHPFMEQVRAWGLITRSISSPVLKGVHILSLFFCGVAYLCGSILIKLKSSWEFL